MKVLLDIPETQAAYIMNELQNYSSVTVTPVVENPAKDVKHSKVFHSLRTVVQEAKDYQDGKKQPVFGCAKGQFHMADDFDAPLDDFAEYM